MPIHISAICTLGCCVIIALQHLTLLSLSHTNTHLPAAVTTHRTLLNSLINTGVIPKSVTHRIRLIIKRADCSQVKLLSLK